MIKYLLIPAVLASFPLASTVVYGQTTGKAPCGSFQKLPNGKWGVVRPVKIENGHTSVMINPGTTIGPGLVLLASISTRLFSRVAISGNPAARGNPRIIIEPSSG